MSVFNGLVHNELAPFISKTVSLHRRPTLSRQINRPPALQNQKQKKYKQLTAKRRRMKAESVSIGGMLTGLEEPPAPPIEFDEKLWHAVVDRVTVYNDDRLVYSLKDGSEITVML